MGIVVKDRGLVVTVRVFCEERKTGELVVETDQNSAVGDGRGRGLLRLLFNELEEVTERSKY